MGRNKGTGDFKRPRGGSSSEIRARFAKDHGGTDCDAGNHGEGTPSSSISQCDSKDQQGAVRLISGRHWHPQGSIWVMAVAMRLGASEKTCAASETAKIP